MKKKKKKKMRGFVSGLRVLCCHANKYENTNLGTCEHDGFHAW